MHYTAAPTEPRGFGTEAALIQGSQVPKVSFLAVQNGVAVKDKSAQKQAKQEVKKEQKLIKKEESLEKKEKSHVMDEEKNLKKERKLLEEEKAAFKKGDTAKLSKLDKKLNELVKAEARDASIADKVAKEERSHEAELSALFENWATSMKHPGSKWGGKHEKVLSKQHKTEKRLTALEQRNTKAEKAQATFLEQRKAFVQGRAQGGSQSQLL